MIRIIIGALAAADWGGDDIGTVGPPPSTVSQGGVEGADGVYPFHAAPLVTLSEDAQRSDLRELVSKTGEDTPSGLLEVEAGDIVDTERYERTAGRGAYLAGHYDRSFAATSGAVTLRVAGLKGVLLATAIIKHYRKTRGTRRGDRDRDVAGGRLEAQDRGGG